MGNILLTGKQANKHDLISFLKDRDLISVKKSSSITKLICFYDVHYEGSTDLFWQPSRSQCNYSNSLHPMKLQALCFLNSLCMLPVL